MQNYCPACFAQIAAGAETCPACGTAFDSFGAGMNYAERLVHTLGHPIDETRMGAIIALGKIGEPETAEGLVALALSEPQEMWQALEVVRSLHKMPMVPVVEAALRRLEESHPVAAVQAVAGHVREEMFTHGRGHGASHPDLIAAARKGPQRLAPA